MSGSRRDSGALTLVGLALVGAGCGVVWWLLVTPATFTKQRGGGAMDETELGQRFAADGWYVVVAFVAAVLCGLVVVRWHQRDSLRAVGLLLVGSVLATLAMVGIGMLLGPGNTQAALTAARPGQHVPVPLSVMSSTAYLSWPLGVALGALVVLGFTDEQHPEPHESHDSQTPASAAG